LALRKSDALDDWYVIERADHDGREWMEPFKAGGVAGAALHCSSRIEPSTDVEGTAAEMRAIAVAIRAGANVSFRRCAVAMAGPAVDLWSPRNSRTPGTVSYTDALDLADAIDSALGLEPRSP